MKKHINIIAFICVGLCLSGCSSTLSTSDSSSASSTGSDSSTSIEAPPTPFSDSTALPNIGTFNEYPQTVVKDATNTTYFSSITRKKVVSDYARATGTYRYSSTGCGYWWLRSKL